MHAHTCTHTRNQWTILLYHNLKICLLVLLETQISFETFGVLRKKCAFSWDVVAPSSDTGDCKSLNIFVKIMQNGVECDKKIMQNIFFRTHNP